MRYTRDHKQHTRQQIVARARKLFAAQGFEATSIEQIMQACKLTRGGFYAHFPSKSALYRESMSAAATRSRWLDAQGRARGESTSLDAMLDHILGAPAEQEPDSAPRLGFLATDAASREPGVRSAYTRAFALISEKINRSTSAGEMTGSANLSAAAMLIGALAVMQTTDDSALKARLIAACKAGAKALLDDPADEAQNEPLWMPAGGTTLPAAPASVHQPA